MTEEHEMKARPEDLQALNIDDTVEMVLAKYPLKFLVQALIRKHGLSSVAKALEEVRGAR